MIDVDRLLERIDLTLPRLPAALEGLRIAHVSDLHVRGRRGEPGRLGRSLGSVRVDLLVLSGDQMDAPGDEPRTLAVLAELCERARPRLGTFGVHGNHDGAEFRRAAEQLPVRWLSDRAQRLDDLPIQIAGMDVDENCNLDALALAAQDGAGGAEAGGDSEGRALRLLLCHLPTALPMASDLGYDLMLSGHTHGGQVRALPGVPVYNSMDWPLRLTSGLLRHRDTLCCVSRGLGEARPLRFRVFCPAHVPIYTLRRGSMPGRRTDGIENVRPW